MRLEAAQSLVAAEGQAAVEPPEARGLNRDEVRLLVVDPSRSTHATFREIGDFLDPGDVLVVNTSATVPAAVDGLRNGVPVVVHVSAPLDDGTWTVELRVPEGSGPSRDGKTGERIDLTGGAHLQIVSSYMGIEGRSRLVRGRFEPTGDIHGYLAEFGRPISYRYVRDRWPLSTYQTIFGREPGSAEMPSAARPFTSDLVVELVARGIVFTPVLLHTSVSSLEAGETPLPERMRVTAETARIVNEARAAGRRVVAVGTSVTRALETAAGEDGKVSAFEGWTDLVLGPARRARVVDGLVTGWHPPEASHRLLLEAVAGKEPLARAYRKGADYLWHEFGDSCLFIV